MPPSLERPDEQNPERPGYEWRPAAGLERDTPPAPERKANAERDREDIDTVRRLFEVPAASSPEPNAAQRYREELYGPFAGERRTGGKIVLEKNAAEAAARASADFRRSAKYMTNTLVGEPIAAEYDIHTRNFSTQTRIASLPDGRKVFIVYDNKGSWLHRALDGFMKRMSGLKMRKVTRAEWKGQFEAKSTIPVIENGDPDTVIMPFQPNVNAHDVFARNGEIGNFGEQGWAKAAGADDKLEMAGAIADEIKRIHGTGTAWGEMILPNVIFTDPKKPIVCDPEVRFDADVPLAEAKARDLKDLCLSVAAALEHAHKETDYGRTVRAILDRYADPEVIAELKKLVSKKRGVLQNLFFGYEKVRTGTTGKKQYDAILKAIAAYEAPRGE